MGIPLIDLHRHLDGSVRLETILEVGLQNNLPLPETELEKLRPHVQVTEPQPGILTFFEKFVWLTRILLNYDICRRIAYENVEDAKNEGIDYIELRFSPWFMADANGLDPYGVTEAVIQGIHEGVDSFGVKVNIIGIISRTYGPDIAWKEFDALYKYREHITALDLAGDEVNYPGELFVNHFKKARDMGWNITIHAGEAAGPESVWYALNELGATRIGHAVTAVEDPNLIDYLAENRIGIESNLTSNYQTSTVQDYASHPLRTFLENGILATINTDDPGISGIDLPFEYEHAAPAAGLTQDQISIAQRNALKVAFIDDKDREKLLRKKSS
ncbi:MAG: adenosine deaminase [Anaerolineaceae bacterium]|nr:adenosine deaminase [Anaerolineaceae bacterium]